jgi:hypothetical protein
LRKTSELTALMLLLANPTPLTLRMLLPNEQPH